MAITAFLSRLLGCSTGGLGAWGPSLAGTWSSFQHLLSNSSEALNSNCSIGGPEGPLCWVLVLSTASYPQLIWTSCRRGYIIIWSPLFFLRASQFRTQFNPSTVKVISWYSSSGCTCYFLFWQLGRVGGQYATHVHFPSEVLQFTLWSRVQFQH